MPEEELELIDGAITATCQRAGINPADPATWNEPAPLTSDFQAAIVERYGSEELTRLAAQSLSGRLERFTTGYLRPMFNRRTNVNLVLTGSGEHVAIQTVDYRPELHLFCTEPFKCRICMRTVRLEQVLVSEL